MSKKRLFPCLIMAIAFTFALTLTAFAYNLTGGKGVVNGLDPSLSYKAKAVTINSEGNACAYGEAFVLDESSNKNLAGLYVVSSDGFATQSEIIYVEGSYANRLALGVFAEGKDMPNASRDRLSSSDVFKVGYYYGVNNTGTDAGITGKTFITDYVFSTAVNNNRNTYGTYSKWPTATDLKNALDASDTAKANEIKTAVKSILESYSVNYAYTSDEIIPADELISMKVARSKRSSYDNFTVRPVSAKVVFVVMDKTGAVKEYTWNGSSKDMTPYSSALVEDTIDVQSVITDKNGWIVAFKYYPVANVSTDAISVLSTGRGTGTEGKRVYDFNIRIGYNESIPAMSDYYVIKVPKAETPKGITYDAATNTLSGLVSGTSYSLVPYTVLGANKSGEITITATGSTYTFTSAMKAGLWGIRIAASASYSESDPIVFYVEGSYKDRANLGTYTGNTINSTRDRGGVTDYWKLGYYYGAAYTSTYQFYNNYGFNGSKTMNIFGAELVPTQKALADAISSNNTAEVVKIKTAVKTALENYFVSYAYTSDEIIPVNELLTMKVARAKLSAFDGFMVSPVTPKVVFAVMDETGKVSEYTWTGTSKALGYYDSTFVEETIDAQSVLPDSGWVVGFRYYPVGEVALDSIKHFSATNTSDRLYELMLKVGSLYSGYYVIEVPKAEKPEGISYDVETNTFSGLKANTKYSLAPYTVLGRGTDGIVEFTATAETHTLTTPLGAGLWGISLAASDSYSESDPIVFYAEGSYIGRQNLGTYNGAVINSTRDRTGITDYWKLGYYYGAAYTSNYQFYNNYGFNGTKAMDIFGTEFVPTQKALAEAIAENNQEEVTRIKTAVKTALENYFVSYAYTSDEIIPVNELLTMKVARAKLSAFDGFMVTPVTAKVVFAVMDETGKVSEYTWTGSSKTLSYLDSTFVEDVVDAQSVLPDSGWVVGFRYYPVGEVALDSITYYKDTNTSDRLYEFMLKVGSIYEGYYEISVPKAETPTGITYDSEKKTLSGLKANTRYAIAQYTIMGRDKDSEIEFTSDASTYTFDSIDAGLWGISYAADDKFATSDPIIFYVKGKSDDRKKIGTYEDGKSTPNAVRDRQSPEDSWKLGYFYGAGIAEGKLSNNYAFNENKVVSIFGADMAPTPKALAEAVSVGDTELADTIRRNVKTILENYFVSYAYTPDEIIPAKELFNIKIGLVKISAFDGFVLTNSRPKIEIYTMNSQGDVSTYTWTGAVRAINYYSNTYIYDQLDLNSAFDFKEDDYIIGFKYYPMQEINTSEITTYGQNPTSAARVYELYFAMGNEYNDFYSIKEDGPTPELSTFPIIPGGYGEISGLINTYVYEVQSYDEATDTWSDWQEIPAGSTAFKVTKAGTYKIRVKDTDVHGKSEEVEIAVYEYGTKLDSFNSQIAKMHLPSDYVELQAEYTMDVRVKNWVSMLAMENIKYASPNSTITLEGEGYKFVVKAKDVSLMEERGAHYYNMAVSFDGESRHDKLYEIFKEKAGDRYITEIYFETSGKLPFKKAQLMIYVGEENNGLDVELKSYFEIIDRLRNVESATVFNGWATFNNYTEPYVVLLPKE